MTTKDSFSRSTAKISSVSTEERIMASADDSSEPTPTLYGAQIDQQTGSFPSMTFLVSKVDYTGTPEEADWNAMPDSDKQDYTPAPSLKITFMSALPPHADYTLTSQSTGKVIAQSKVYDPGVTELNFALYKDYTHGPDAYSMPASDTFLLEFTGMEADEVSTVQVDTTGGSLIIVANIDGSISGVKGPLETDKSDSMRNEAILRDDIA